MRIGGGNEGTFGRGARLPVATAVASESPGRALTVVAAPSAREAATLARGDAAFLAQLIATKVQMPQTRARRRAEPDEAIAAYRAAAQRVARW